MAQGQKGGFYEEIFMLNFAPLLAICAARRGILFKINSGRMAGYTAVYRFAF